jgi:hypothetical protein
MDEIVVEVEVVVTLFVLSLGVVASDTRCRPPPLPASPSSACASLCTGVGGEGNFALLISVVVVGSLIMLGNRGPVAVVGRTNSGMIVERWDCGRAGRGVVS